MCAAATRSLQSRNVYARDSMRVTLAQVGQTHTQTLARTHTRTHTIYISIIGHSFALIASLHARLFSFRFKRFSVWSVNGRNGARAPLGKNLYVVFVQPLFNDNDILTGCFATRRTNVITQSVFFASTTYICICVGAQRERSIAICKWQMKVPEGKPVQSHVCSCGSCEVCRMFATKTCTSDGKSIKWRRRNSILNERIFLFVWKQTSMISSRMRNENKQRIELENKHFFLEFHHTLHVSKWIYLFVFVWRRKMRVWFDTNAECSWNECAATDECACEMREKLPYLFEAQQSKGVLNVQGK